MRILCTNKKLDARGGSESYLETVTDELVRLGHDVHLWSFENGMVAERLQKLGCTVHDDLATVGEIDVVHAQHASAALEARAAYPDVPMVFVAHSWFLRIEDPPELAAPAALVALNNRVEEWLRSTHLAEGVRVHRLRQPVTMSAAELQRVPIGDTPMLALAISRNLASRLGLLRDACAQLGIELEVFQTSPEPSDRLTEAIMRADIVFAVGRTAIEAMEKARATFIFDETGSAGFITADRYDAFEASGFTPAAGSSTRLEDVVAELRRYDRSLGQMARELVGRHHAARLHVTQLVDVYRSVAGTPSAFAIGADAARTLAGMEERNFELELRVRQAEWERARLDRELRKMRDSWSWRLTRPLRLFRRSPDD